MTLASPRSDATRAELADWLELNALLSETGTAHTDVILNALGIEQDEENDDFGQSDVEKEQIIEGISEAIRERQEALTENAYPFSMSQNGEKLVFVSQDNYGHKTYIICLLISHSWASGILSGQLKMLACELLMGRTCFEIISAVASIGIVTPGISFWIGSNRSKASGLHRRLVEICNEVGEVRARPTVEDAAPVNANDDGVDVLAVAFEIGGPPHRQVVFGQAASGADFKKKSMKADMEGFMDIWFSVRPTNPQAALFVPAFLELNDRRYFSKRLGHVYHRLNLPAYAERGFSEFTKNETRLRYVDDVELPVRWIDQCLQRIRQIFAS